MNRDSFYCCVFSSLFEGVTLRRSMANFRGNDFAPSMVRQSICGEEQNIAATAVEIKSVRQM